MKTSSVHTCKHSDIWLQYRHGLSMFLRQKICRGNLSSSVACRAGFAMFYISGLCVIVTASMALIASGGGTIYKVHCGTWYTCHAPSYSTVPVFTHLLLLLILLPLSGFKQEGVNGAKCAEERRVFRYSIYALTQHCPLLHTPSSTLFTTWEE